MEFFLGLHPERCRFSSILSAVDQINEKHRSSWAKPTRFLLADVPDYIRSQSEAKMLSLAQIFLMDTWTQRNWVPYEHMKNRPEFSSVFLGFVHFVGFCVQFWILWPGNFSSEGGGEMSTCIWCYSLMWLWTIKISLKKGQRRLRVSLNQNSLFQPTKLGSQLP